MMRTAAFREVLHGKQNGLRCPLQIKLIILASASTSLARQDDRDQHYQTLHHGQQRTLPCPAVLKYLPNRFDL